VCDNSFFNGISDAYEIVTKNGVYQAPPVPLTQAQIDSGMTAPAYTEVFIEAGDLAELRCVESTPPRLPLTDLADDDPRDFTITAFCMYPQADGLKGR